MNDKRSKNSVTKDVSAPTVSTDIAVLDERPTAINALTDCIALMESALQPGDTVKKHQFIFVITIMKELHAKLDS